MKLVVSYDIETSTPEGRRRLRLIARACERKGNRVQASVFEMDLDPAQLRAFMAELSTLMDPKLDSIRFYSLGRHWESRIQTLGPTPAPERYPLMWV